MTLRSLVPPLLPPAGDQKSFGYVTCFSINLLQYILESEEINASTSFLKLKENALCYGWQGWKRIAPSKKLGQFVQLLSLYLDYLTMVVFPLKKSTSNFLLCSGSTSRKGVQF